MGEGRNKILENALDIEKKAKKKAMKHTILTIVTAIILIILTNIIAGGMNIYLLIGISLPFIGIFAACYFLLAKVYKDEETQKINTALVEKCLSTEYLTEVIPINACEHKEFILGLVDIAKFYAKISKEDDTRVEIYVKISNEEGTRFLENVYTGCFLKYYSIQEENEQEKKD